MPFNIERPANINVPTVTDEREDFDNNSPKSEEKAQALQEDIKKLEAEREAKATKKED